MPGVILAALFSQGKVVTKQAIELGLLGVKSRGRCIAVLNEPVPTMGTLCARRSATRSISECEAIGVHRPQPPTLCFRNPQEMLTADDAREKGEPGAIMALAGPNLPALRAASTLSAST